MSTTQSSSIIATPIEELQNSTESISREQLQLLVRMVDQSDIVELEVTHGCNTQVCLILRKSRSLLSDAPTTELYSSPPIAATSQETEPSRTTITAACVGFFQAGSKAKSKPLVGVGDAVKEGQLVALIRSLGVTNEVESPTTGRIAEILVQDGQPVEYGQPLLVIENA